jgi:HAMP domain-containing protein/HPt (histidine-containing phosphotransfer) domain-containing protein
MKILEPAIQLIGRLSFRNKLRVTAIVFGLPLIIALGLILSGINERVAKLQEEREALSVQIPTLSLMSSLHQYLAASRAYRDGDESLQALVKRGEADTQAALKKLQAEMAQKGHLTGKLTTNQVWLDNLNADIKQIGELTQGDELGELQAKITSNIRNELDKLNEDAGLLVDSDTASSRLIDILTAQIPELIDTTGKTASIGTPVLVNQRIKNRARLDLTLLRGNFNVLVQWSMGVLDKVTRDNPRFKSTLDDSGSRLNTAYLKIQEMMTTKMLETADFSLTPIEFLEITDSAFKETLAVTAVVFNDTDTLLNERLVALENQRNAIFAAILGLVIVLLASFVAAYISIMRGLNGLSDAVAIMASGDLSARIEVSSRDEIGEVSKQFNRMVENLAERTTQLYEKTNDIHAMLQNLPQGILTVDGSGTIHPEYSSFLEKIFEQEELSGKQALTLIFSNSSVGTDTLSQIEATLAACIGEDLMNYEMNSHLLVGEFTKPMADGRVKCLDLTWAPICDASGAVEKIMVCVRDITELRQLEIEAAHQKRELELIGQILKVNQEKFADFVSSSRQFVADNEALLKAAIDKDTELITQLFRNMHTIKGNARTYGLLHLTNIVHEAEQAYDELRKDSAAVFDQAALLAQLEGVAQSIEEYAAINEHKLGRKGPGRRGSAEKYVMIERAHLERIQANLAHFDFTACHPQVLVSTLEMLETELNLIGTEPAQEILDGVFDSLPALAKELGKEPPSLPVIDHGIQIRNQITDLLRNVFMHLYRNAMDHGLEAAALRFAQGKPAAGRIQLELALNKDRLEFRLKDDGKGLALGHIRQKAVSRGLLGEGEAIADEAVAKLIFAAGFSTASAVTEVSGRGVGMDAVQNFIKREGGEIRLELTDENVGADFRQFETIISLPAKFAVLSQPASPGKPVVSGAFSEVAPDKSGRLVPALALTQLAKA